MLDLSLPQDVFDLAVVWLCRVALLGELQISLYEAALLPQAYVLGDSVLLIRRAMFALMLGLRLLACAMRLRRGNFAEWKQSRDYLGLVGPKHR